MTAPVAADRSKNVIRRTLTMTCIDPLASTMINLRKDSL
jgi:hypothetical protein